jgi:hypothetical protein
MPELVYKLCLLGATNESIADILGVALSTFHLFKKIPEFSDALNSGRDIADANVAVSLYQRACGYSHQDIHISNFQGEITQTPIVKHYAPDTGAAKLWLKNRQPDKWRERIEVVDPDNPLLELAKAMQGGALFPGRQVSALPSGNGSSVIPGRAIEIEDNEDNE